MTVDDPPIEGIEPKEFGDMAYVFMTGIPGFGTRGFCMMGPDELRNQRINHVRYWRRLLQSDMERALAASRG